VTYIIPDTSTALATLFTVYPVTDADQRLLWSTRPKPSFAETVVLWPATSFAGVNNNPAVDNTAFVPRAEFARDVKASGTHPQKVITGVCRDVTAAPLSGATVKAFRTSADATNALPADLQEGVPAVSAADGAYTVTVPNTDPHYLVSYKAGTPDVAGTTTNTLVGV
jgi:hypothetical protein